MPACLNGKRQTATHTLDYAFYTHAPHQLVHMHIWYRQSINREEDSITNGMRKFQQNILPNYAAQQRLIVTDCRRPIVWRVCTNIVSLVSPTYVKSLAVWRARARAQRRRRTVRPGDSRCSLSARALASLMINGCIYINNRKHIRRID